MLWQCGRFQISLDAPKIMGIVNITPDSFSDGGRYSSSVEQTLQHAKQLLEDGTDVLDVGGESTRPGSEYVSAEVEWQRVAPVLQELHQWGVPISLDTRRPWVMQQALEHGWVDAINDVSALTGEGALELLAAAQDIGVCLMHMQGLPESMQHNPQYADVTQEVMRYLQQRVDACLNAGIVTGRLLLDPGFGFGKTLQHNLDLMQDLTSWIQTSQLPILVGVSRKTMLGSIIDEPNPAARVTASVVAAIAAIARGAHMVRVHDVKETVEAVKVWQKLGVWAQ